MVLSPHGLRLLRVWRERPRERHEVSGLSAKRRIDYARKCGPERGTDSRPKRLRLRSPIRPSPGGAGRPATGGLVSEKRRIFVVDDQREILDLAALVLQGAGFHVDTAESGIVALERLRQCLPDLVLLDVNMPTMDGWQTLKAIRAQPGFESLPVAMFSVKGELHDKVHSLQEGATGYITKPFEVDELVRRVERLLNAGPESVQPSTNSSTAERR